MKKAKIEKTPVQREIDRHSRTITKLQQEEKRLEDRHDAEMEKLHKRIDDHRAVLKTLEGK